MVEYDEYDRKMVDGKVVEEESEVSEAGEEKYDGEDRKLVDDLLKKRKNLNGAKWRVESEEEAGEEDGKKEWKKDKLKDVDAIAEAFDYDDFDKKMVDDLLKENMNDVKPEEEWDSWEKNVAADLNLGGPDPKNF